MVRLLRASLTVVAACAALGLAACAASPSPARGPDRDPRVREVIELVEEWARVASEGRWADARALYADEPGFAWTEQGRLAYPDFAAVVAGIEAAQRSKVRVDMRVRDVVAVPLARDAAAVRASYMLRFDVAPGQTVAQSGMLTAVAVRRGGRWQFLQGHLSSPAAGEAPR